MANEIENMFMQLHNRGVQAEQDITVPDPALEYGYVPPPDLGRRIPATPVDLNNNVIKAPDAITPFGPGDMAGAATVLAAKDIATLGALAVKNRGSLASIPGKLKDYASSVKAELFPARPSKAALNEMDMMVKDFNRVVKSADHDIPADIINKYKNINSAFQSGERSSIEIHKSVMNDFEKLRKSGKLDDWAGDADIGVLYHSTTNPKIGTFKQEHTKTSYRNIDGTYFGKGEWGGRKWAGSGEHTIPVVYRKDKIANMDTPIPEKYRALVGTDVSHVPEGKLTVADLVDTRKNNALGTGIPKAKQVQNRKVLEDMGYEGYNYTKARNPSKLGKNFEDTVDEVILFDKARVKALYGNDKYSPSNANIYKSIIGGSAVGAASQQDNTL